MLRIKFILAMLLGLFLLSCSLSDKIQQKVEQKVNEKIDKTIDDAMNKMDTAVSKMSLDSLKKLTKSIDSSFNNTKDKNIQKLKEKQKNIIKNK